MPVSAIMTVMINAVRKASRGLNRDFGEVENLQVSRKGPSDFVTKADRKVEEILHDELLHARPTYGFVMEEGGTEAGTDGQHRWIIDPIDGTTNFIHGIPHFALSVGLQRGEDIVAAVIFNPISNELFTAERGRGAYLDDRRLRVAARTNLSDAVITCGIPHLGRGDHPQFQSDLLALQDKVAGIRRFGAASLDLAYVAAGRVDGYFERGLKSWDIAAGLLIVAEAGGRIGDINTGQSPLKTGNILAANDTLFMEMQKALNS